MYVKTGDIVDWSDPNDDYGVRGGRGTVGGFVALSTSPVEELPQSDKDFVFLILDDGGFVDVPREHLTVVHSPD